mmetsp:Transcript_35874/g.90391  ORF Transcript_35874/g.90391 Transcript_35874/m.90391 type:complete len:394 (+) Transcript_35874:520-1701(+)
MTLWDDFVLAVRRHCHDSSYDREICFMLQTLKKSDPEFAKAVKGYDPVTIVATFQRHDQTSDKTGTLWLSYEETQHKQAPKSALKAPPGVSLPMTPTVVKPSLAVHGDALTPAPLKKVTMSSSAADQAAAAAVPFDHAAAAVALDQAAAAAVARVQAAATSAAAVVPSAVASVPYDQATPPHVTSPTKTPTPRDTNGPPPPPAPLHNAPLPPQDGDEPVERESIGEGATNNTVYSARSTSTYYGPSVVPGATRRCDIPEITFEVDKNANVITNLVKCWNELTSNFAAIHCGSIVQLATILSVKGMDVLEFQMTCSYMDVTDVGEPRPAPEPLDLRRFLLKDRSVFLTTPPTLTIVESRALHSIALNGQCAVGASHHEHAKTIAKLTAAFEPKL